MWKVVVGTAVFTIPVSLMLFDVCGYVAKVEGSSMQPALNPGEWKISDYVFLNRWSSRKYKFERGEIVCLICPSNPKQRIIKRIIGLEGDTVNTLSYRSRFVTIPPGHCWVEGDHHSLSVDSNVFGPVALGLINSKASHVVWPPRRWQRLMPIDVRNRLSWKHQGHTQRQNKFAASCLDGDEMKRSTPLTRGSDIPLSKTR